MLHVNNDWSNRYICLLTQRSIDQPHSLKGPVILICGMFVAGSLWQLPVLSTKLNHLHLDRSRHLRILPVLAKAFGEEQFVWVWLTDINDQFGLCDNFFTLKSMYRGRDVIGTRQIGWLREWNWVEYWINEVVLCLVLCNVYITRQVPV